MISAVPAPPARLSDQPLYSLLVQFPVVCFVGALVTDLAYVETNLFMWETFSVWLLAAGCVMAGLAGIAGLIAFVRHRALRSGRFAWPHAILSLLAALLSVVNAFVHSRDGYTAVMPEGVALSAAVVVLMAIAAVFGSAHDVRRVQRTGVAA